MALTPQEFFFKLSKIQRILIVVGVNVLIMVGFYFLLISDMRAQMATLEEQIGRIELEIMNQKKTLEEGPRLKAQIIELEQRLQSMVASLPEKQDIEALLKTITDLLSESNLVAKRFAPGQEQINEELYYATIPIHMNLRGDYQMMGQFLASLHDLPRIVNVPSIRLSRAGGLTGKELDMARKLDIILLDADVSAVTFRRLSPAEIKAITDRKAARPGGPPPPRPKR